MTAARRSALIVSVILYLTSGGIRASKRCRQFAAHVPFSFAAQTLWIRIVDLYMNPSSAVACINRALMLSQLHGYIFTARTQ